MTKKAATKAEKAYDYKIAFQEALKLIEIMVPFAGQMPIKVKDETAALLKKYYEEVYGIKNYLGDGE